MVESEIHPLQEPRQRIDLPLEWIEPLTSIRVFKNSVLMAVFGAAMTFSDVCASLVVLFHASIDSDSDSADLVICRHHPPDASLAWTEPQH